MADYKAMYYHLAGRMATAVDVLEATTDMMKANVAALEVLKDKLKMAQLTTEELFIDSANNDDL